MSNKLRAAFDRIFKKNAVSQKDYEQLEDENTPPPHLNIEFSDSRRIITSGLIIIGVFFGIGGLWVAIAEISGAVVVPGEVRVDTERKSVQHLEGGIVQEILVRNGDLVTAGQPLIRLESSRVVAGTDQLNLQLAGANIEFARLDAEKDMDATPEWPQRPDSVPENKFNELLTSAKKVFTSNRNALKSEMGLLEKQIAQLNQQDISLDGRLAAGEEIVATLQEELEAKLVLYKEKYIDKTRILELRRVLAQHQGELAQLKGSRAELLERMAEFQIRLNALGTDYRQKAVTRQSEVERRLFDLQQQILPLKDARRRLNVSAPVSGEVVALNVHSVGGVVKPGETLLDIVPKDSPLIVETRIMVKDITHVSKGQKADVQLNAFNLRSTPKIEGEVVYISADRILQRTPYGEQPSYIVHVELNKKELTENDLYLTAGMPTTVFIQTEPRTVLDYALEPLLTNFDLALREN